MVLTKGGHNGGILSPPGHPDRHYRIGHRPAGAHYIDPDAWLARHAPQPGSWWPEWRTWLDGLSGMPDAPPGSGAPGKMLPILDTAPGRYVLEP